jgi:hypothetical protein
VDEGLRGSTPWGVVHESSHGDRGDISKLLAVPLDVAQAEEKELKALTSPKVDGDTIAAIFVRYDKTLDAMRALSTAAKADDQSEIVSSELPGSARSSGRAYSNSSAVLIASTPITLAFLFLPSGAGPASCIVWDRIREGIMPRWISC